MSKAADLEAGKVATPTATPADLQAAAKVVEASAPDTPSAIVKSGPIAAPLMPATPIAIVNNSPGGWRSVASDVAGTSADARWGSANSGGGWSSYRQGKKKVAAGVDTGLMGKSPGSDAGGGSSKAGRRARRNAKKAAADAKADVYAY